MALHAVLYYVQGVPKSLVFICQESLLVFHIQNFPPIVENSFFLHKINKGDIKICWGKLYDCSLVDAWWTASDGVLLLHTGENLLICLITSNFKICQSLFPHHQLTSHAYASFDYFNTILSGWPKISYCYKNSKNKNITIRSGVKIKNMKPFFNFFNTIVYQAKKHKTRHQTHVGYGVNLIIWLINSNFDEMCQLLFPSSHSPGVYLLYLVVSESLALQSLSDSVSWS